MGCDGFRSSQSPQSWIYWENATDEIQDYPYYYLVGGIPTPLKNDGVKVSGMMTFPTVSGKSQSKFHGSSQHQAVIVSSMVISVYKHS